MIIPILSIDQWGKDHWSTFSYIETRCVDHRGVLKNANMRTHASRHPLFLARGFASPGDGSSYPTIHKGGELPDHDDWDCLYDMVQSGLLTVQPKDDALWDVPVGSRGPIQHRGRLQRKELKVTVKLTDLGHKVAGELRAHLANKLRYQEFSPSFAPAVGMGMGMAVRKPEEQEEMIQCGYHFGDEMLCRLVQLRHRIGISNWQHPKWVCDNCRIYLRGLFRYYKEAA